jgi:hypothetical protein
MPPQGNRPAPLGHFKMDVAAAQHRLGLLLPPTLRIQAARNSLLAVRQDFGNRFGSLETPFFRGLVSLITSQQIQD